ncbi:hypothetical protein [Serratia sp. 22264]|uniref:hypothetical protein n=1 Tax=Serratia sp. 22264 TaxID=3453897 RepID=UPI003F827B68
MSSENTTNKGNQADQQRPGAPKGNFNALKHGNRSRRLLKPVPLLPGMPDSDLGICRSRIIHFAKRADEIVVQNNGFIPFTGALGREWEFCSVAIDINLAMVEAIMLKKTTDEN